MEPDTRLAQLAADQHGVFSIREAEALGVPERTIRARCARGRYVRLATGVYTVAGSADSPQRRLVAAVRSFPLPTAVSHQSAAELWGLARSRSPRTEVVTRRWNREHRTDLVVHESLDLEPLDIVLLAGVPVTTPARTVVDLGASNPWVVESALENAIRGGLLTLDDVEAFVRRVARRGRRGVGVIRPLLALRRKWDTTTESVLEDKLRKLVAEAGLPAPVPQFVVNDPEGEFVARSDFAYPDHRVLIELDSEAYHMDRLAFRKDRAKQNSAVLLGWTVLRYTWFDVVRQPNRVTSEIAAAIRFPA